jgi:methionine synthase I (cobalamin-dependent)
MVFASIGPTGKVLAAGEMSEEEALAAFREQAHALAEGGADALLIETMSDLGEATLALAGARATGLPVLVSFAFESGKNRDRTMTGATPEQVAHRMTEEGADGVGANCGVGIAEYVPICRRLRAATSLPLWIKPNAGLPELVNGRPVYRIGPDQFASHIPALVEAGANFVGGCCGTDPRFISAGARALVRP